MYVAGLPDTPASGGVERAPLQLHPQPPFRLVLPRDKQERLARRLRDLGSHRACVLPDCGQVGLAVVLVETEQEAVLCPRHELVGLDGAPVTGQPVLATGGW